MSSIIFIVRRMIIQYIYKSKLFFDEVKKSVDTFKKFPYI